MIQRITLILLIFKLLMSLNRMKLAADAMKQAKDPYLEAAMIPDYIENESMAKEAVKTVFGVFVSSLSKEDIYYFTAHLPAYLSFLYLRDQQEDISSVSPDDCIILLKDKIGLSEKQAENLMFKIVNVIEPAPKDKNHNITEHLSDDWKILIQMLQSSLITLNIPR